MLAPLRSMVDIWSGRWGLFAISRFLSAVAGGGRTGGPSCRRRSITICQVPALARFEGAGDR